MTKFNTPATVEVSPNDLSERAGMLGRFGHNLRDNRRAGEALDVLAKARTEEQVAIGTAVIRTAGAVAIAAVNARGVEQLATVQLALDARVQGAIESAGSAEDRTIRSSGSLRTEEVGQFAALRATGRLTAGDEEYATERANARHVDRLGRAERRYTSLVDGFDQAAAEAVRRSSVEKR